MMPPVRCKTRADDTHNTQTHHIMSKQNALNWFDLYVTDLIRARAFYSTILGAELDAPDGPDTGMEMAIFPFDYKNGIGGALVKKEGLSPGAGGTLIYLNVEGDLDGVLSRIPAAGGTVLQPRLAIGEHGFIAIIRDTEGNTVGLHSLS